MSKILKVGRSTLREAVKILTFSGVLDVKHGSGTYVKKDSYKNSMDFSTSQLLEAREMIEVSAVEQIIHKGYNTDNMLEIKEILFRRNMLLENGKFADYISCDLEFHLSIVKLSGNPFLIKWYEEIQDDLREYLSSQIMRLSQYSDNTALHNELYQAIVDLDIDKAINKIKENNINT